MENNENITEVKLDNKQRAYATGKRKNICSYQTRNR